MPAPTRLTDRTQPPVELPKDDVELRLEKALFGDDAGFLASLQRQETAEDWSLTRHAEDGFNVDDNAEDDLSDAANDDVGILSDFISLC